MREQLPRLTLDDRQERVVQRVVSEPTRSALNASLMGVGKTVMGVETAIRLSAKTVLIIGPLNTYWGWYDTIQRQTEYKATITKIDSTKTGKQAFEDIKMGKDGWYFVGREYFRTKDWAGIVPDIAMVDECHFAQNRKSKSFKTLKTLKPKFKLSMSGTPFGNKFEGFWAVSRWLWPNDQIVDKSFWRWVDKYCETQYSPFSQMDIIGEREPGAFAKTLPCYIRLFPAKEIDTVSEVRYVDLVPSQRRVYEKFQKDLVVWLEENPLVAEVPVAARIRLRQMTLAVPSIADDGGVYFEDDAVSTKYKALAEIIEDNPTDPMLILTDSQKYARIVVNRLNAKGEVAFEWSGMANQKQREEAKQEFLNGTLKYIVAVIPAIAEGVDGLQDVCSTVVWLSHSDSNILNQQVLDRIRRRGQKEIVKVYDIIARDTYDEGQLSGLIETQLKMNASLRKGA